MTSRKLFAALAALAMIALGAQAGVVDATNSSATCADCPATLTSAPGGYESVPTVDVWTLDAVGDPVEVASTDIWLEHADVVFCAGGFVADSSTYAPDPGHTSFSGIPRGGVALGADCAGIQFNVIAVGVVIDVLDLNNNSFDLDGSGAVDISDLGVFATAYQGTVFCADYDETGAVDISDLGMFASIFNLSNCP